MAISIRNLFGRFRPAAPSRAVVSDRILNDEAALKFIGFGFDFSQAAFDDILENLRRTMAIRARPQASDRQYLDGLKDALMASCRAALLETGAHAVRIGISGGLDSRLLYSAYRELLPADRIFTYTIGYPGQYDYEYVRQLGGGFFLNHHLLDTRDITWNLEEEVLHKSKLSSPGSYSARRHMLSHLNEAGAPAHNVHGFLGDTLVGGTKPDSHLPVVSWDDAKARFIKKNNRFKMQKHLLPKDVSALLPPEPQPVSGLDQYDLLDFGLRQHQRILPNSSKKPMMITPLADDRWMTAIMARDNLAEREHHYFQFLKEWAPDVFAEVVTHNIDSREQHQIFRRDLTGAAATALRETPHLNRDGTTYYAPLTSKGGNPLSGRQFCERAEYSNNPSFRQMVDTATAGLRRRSLLADAFLSQTIAAFEAGELTAADQMLGLVSLEINIRAGTLLRG